MFVSKKYHNLRIHFLEDCIDIMRSGHLAQIETLKAQIEDLRTLVFPKTSKTPDPMVLEADSVISGSDKPIQISEKEHQRIFEDSREVDLLFSGNYSEDLLQ